MVTWGDPACGGDSSSVHAALTQGVPLLQQVQPKRGLTWLDLMTCKVTESRLLNDRNARFFSVLLSSTSFCLQFPPPSCTLIRGCINLRNLWFLRSSKKRGNSCDLGRCKDWGRLLIGSAGVHS